MKTVHNRLMGSSGGKGCSSGKISARMLRKGLMIVLIVLAFSGLKVRGQGVGISEVNITPDPSSILELRSVQRGLLIPRMTTAQRLAISSPAAGLIVYDTDTKSFWYFDGIWKTVPASLAGGPNQLLGMNAAGTQNEFKTLVGTGNQVYVTHAPGSITLSLPQDIHTGANITFNSLILSSLLPNAGVYTDNNSRLTTTPPTTGIIGYWTRTGNILSPANADDNVTTSGNIYTTGDGNIYTAGTGAITSAGLLSGLSGAAINGATSITGPTNITGITGIIGALTVSGGIINLNDNSNYDTRINTGSSTGNVVIGNAGSSLYLPKFTTAGVLHNDATGLVSSGLIVNDDIQDGTIDLTQKVTGVLPIANGGTNSGTALSGQSIMISNGSAIVQGEAGTTTTVLHGNASGAPYYAKVDLVNDIAGTLPVGNGGTGLTTFGGNNTVLFTSSPDVLTWVPASTAPGQFLQTTTAGGAPTWKSVLDVANGGTGLSSITSNNLIYGNGTGAVNLLAPSGTAGSLLMESVTGAPVWSTLNGLPSTSGILQVQNGGTGFDNTFSNGQLLIGNSLGTLSRNTLTGTNNQVNVVNGDGTITLSLPQDIHTGAEPVFLGMTLSGLTPNAGVYTDGSSKLTTTPPSSGILGYWTRDAVSGTLSPSNSGDHIMTSGDIYTTDNGTITSAGLLTGQSGATITGATTISGGIINLNDNSNYDTRINTGSSTGNVVIGNAGSSLYLPKFTTAGVLHNDATGLVSSGLIVNDDIQDGTIDLTQKVTGVLPIANGGTNNGSLAVTDGGVIYTDGTKMMNTGAGTAGQILRSTGAGAPVWSTPSFPNTANNGKLMIGDGTNWVETDATYPSSTTAYQLLYSSAENTVTGLPTSNNGVLITDGTGVPSISSTLPLAVQG
ncbi:MAG TPA: hypothetical protein P5151_05320, partial [Bacteroidales bacterium]|nr:hypothetical protein [Bacteroidales bacterium]